MIYREEKRDLFSVSGKYYLAHCISADFGMGKGIAVEFNKRFDMKEILKRKYPNYRKRYVLENKSGDCILEGKVFNLVTKERYWNKPTIISMRNALAEMKTICVRENISRIAMPTIGAGLDRLSWNDVAGEIREVFVDTDVEILVCKL